jgi:actin related protein 2/3 complex subunit 2
LASETIERDGATKSQIQISISVKCFSELVQYGAQDILQREYGPFIVEPESGYDFSVIVSLDDLPAEEGMQLRDLMLR